MKKIKIRSIICIYALLLSFSICALSAKNLVKAASANIRYITTSVGSDETSVGINFHIDVNNAKIAYAKTLGFSDVKYKEATLTPWSFDQVGDDTASGFKQRYVGTCTLTDLDENTQYYYKVVSGSEESEVRSFKTYAKNGASTSFLFATDIHASNGWTAGCQQAEKTITNVLSTNRKINVAIITGDSVDRGGYEATWKALFDNVKSLNNILQASIPGNHEYYHSKDGGYISPEIYNQFYNNPKNGCEQRMNSSYYFNYGNVLVIMLDTINKQFVEEQQAWFKEVVRNNPTQWLIVGTHAGGITAGSYTDDANWIKKNWTPIFEDCQVDLALSGHEHVYIRKDLVYQDQVNDTINGVTYLVGTSAGLKQYSGRPYPDQIYKNANGTANIITVNKRELICTLYDQTGTPINEFEFKLTPKRSNIITELDDEAILNGLTYEYDFDEQIFNLNWIPEYYGNVQALNVERVLRGKSYKMSQTINSSIATTKEVPNVYNTNNYKINVEIIKKDGSILNKSFDLINHTPHKIEAHLNGGSFFEGVTLNEYLEGIETFLPQPFKENAIFGGWYTTSDFSGDKIERISATETKDLTIYAKWYHKCTITYVLNGGTNEDNPVTSYTEGTSFLLPEPTNGNLEFGGWYINEDFTGDALIGIDAQMTGDLVLYARWVQDRKVTLELNGGSVSSNITSYKEGTKTVLPTPEKKKHEFLGWYLTKDFTGEALTEIPTSMSGDITLYAKWNKLKGCKKSMVVVEMICSLSLLSIVFYKKRS